MKLLWSGAAAVLAASSMVLGGCATDQPKAAEKEVDKNACRGVAPPTGSMVRRKEDCGAARVQDEQAKREIIDQIRSQPGLSGTVVKPGG